jgi:hypothetical protein
MRTEIEVTEDLRKVRARRLSMFPTQGEPLSGNSPRPASYMPDVPGGEITDLLEMEAMLVVERADIRRLQGTSTTIADQEEEATARRILRRLAEKRTEEGSSDDQTAEGAEDQTHKGAEDQPHKGAEDQTHKGAEDQTHEGAEKRAARGAQQRSR